MRIINKMTIQPNTPNDNKVLWLNGSSASYYNNGTWVTIGKSSEDEKELKEKVDSLDKGMDQVNKDLKKLDNRSSQMEESIKNISVTGGASVAEAVTYDNTSSGLEAVNIKGAIDELQGSKIDKTSILQESGEAEDKVMSQKAVSDKLSDLKTELTEKANNDDISIKKVKSTSAPSLLKLFDFNRRNQVYFNDEPITGIVNSIEAYVDSASTNYIYKISKTTNKAIYLCSISGNSDAGWVRKDVANIKFNDEYIGIAAIKIPYSEQIETVLGKIAAAKSNITMLSEGDKDIIVDSGNSKYSFGIKANYTVIEKIDFTSTFNELKTEVAEKASLIKKWKNKKYLAIGDSITFGVGTTMPYPKIVADTLGMTLNNVAHSGDPLHYALAIWDNLDNYDYDLITISLGTNNFVPTVSGCDGIGDSWFIKENGNNIFYTSDSKNIYATNFKVAFNNLCSRVLEHCPTAKILVLTPIHRLNEYTENGKGKILKDYVNTIKEGCKLWGIECVDMYELININPNIHSKLTTYFIESQQNMGLHPNKLAHDLMAEVLFKKL